MLIMTYKLFIDDERWPIDDGNHPRVIARSSADAIAAVESLGFLTSSATIMIWAAKTLPSSSSDG
jgi:hypothetical protein